MMCGCQGVNGGGWAHYVGQEKVRPITGFAQYAFALDWQRPTRQMITTAYWYLATDQWRYDGLPVEALASPLAGDTMKGKTAGQYSWKRQSGAGCRRTRRSTRTRSTLPMGQNRPAWTCPPTLLTS